MIVTQNSTLAGWIEDHKKNKAYTEYMDRAVRMYRMGAPKEIVVGVGLCEPREYEKSYKYCREELVKEPEYTEEKDKGLEGTPTRQVVDLGTVGEYKSALDIVAEDISIPETVGIKEITV